MESAAMVSTRCPVVYPTTHASGTVEIGNGAINAGQMDIQKLQEPQVGVAEQTRVLHGQQALRGLTDEQLQAMCEASWDEVESASQLATPGTSLTRLQLALRELTDEQLKAMCRTSWNEGLERVSKATPGTSLMRLQLALRALSDRQLKTMCVASFKKDLERVAKVTLATSPGEISERLQAVTQRNQRAAMERTVIAKEQQRRKLLEQATEQESPVGPSRTVSAPVIGFGVLSAMAVGYLGWTYRAFLGAKADQLWQLARSIRS